MTDVHDFTSVPEGAHRIRIDEVRQRETRAGDKLLALRLVVAGGELDGRTAAWDNLVFSTRGLARVRLVLGALGVKLDHATELDLEGREAIVQIRPAEYLDAAGDVVRRNEVPYDGWRTA